MPDFSRNAEVFYFQSVVVEIYGEKKEETWRRTCGSIEKLCWKLTPKLYRRCAKRDTPEALQFSVTKQSALVGRIRRRPPLPILVSRWRSDFSPKFPGTGK